MQWLEQCASFHCGESAIWGPQYIPFLNRSPVQEYVQKIKLPVPGASFSEWINLWGLGGDASLNLTTVAINRTLCQPDAPHSFSSPSASFSSYNYSPLQSRQCGPAERERNCLCAAPHQAAKAGVPVPVSVLGTAPVMSSSSTFSAPETSTVLDASVFAVTDGTQELSIQFKCGWCDYNNITEKGLRYHIWMKHRISQLDGIDNSGLKEDVSAQSEYSLCL